MQRLSLVPTLFLWVFLTFVFLTGCDGGDGPLVVEKPDQSLGRSPADFTSRVFDGRDSLTTGLRGPVATKTNFSIVTQVLEIQGEDDVGRIGITQPDDLAPSTLLFENRAGLPILAPDGRHVTWGEFSGATGAIIVQCTQKGTHVVVHLTRLIPKGLYTIQHRLFDPGSRTLLGNTGFTETKSKERSSERGDRSTFRASGNGEGHIRGLVRSRALPDIGSCMLEDVEATLYDWHTVALYQMDGTPSLDGAGTFVEQGVFAFDAEDSGGVE